MELICRDPECVGNDLPAGRWPEDRECLYCHLALFGPGGSALVRGMVPLVDGEPPTGFDALLDGLRDGRAQLVELSVAEEGPYLLYSALADDGRLLAAGVCDADADYLLDLMALVEC